MLSTLKLTLASRFGNFIGEAEESEEESQNGLNGADAYLEEEEEEEDETAVNDQQLMALNGMRKRSAEQEDHSDC